MPDAIAWLLLICVVACEIVGWSDDATPAQHLNCSALGIQTTVPFKPTQQRSPRPRIPASDLFSQFGDR
jgi:hypothetical protein